MSDERKVSRVQAAFRMHEVPPEKWPRVVQRTVTGAVFIVVGVAGAALWTWPWYVAAGLVGLGATTWSTQMVTGALKALLGPVAAWKRAMRDGADA